MIGGTLWGESSLYCITAAIQRLHSLAELENNETTDGKTSSCIVEGQ